MKEVWEELDGLDPNRFNPKTFFILHGKVGREARPGLSPAALASWGLNTRRGLPALEGLRQAWAA